ncbi:MAG: hypothetical protein KGH98_00835 [Candidatus Micrarchaeota archaeon]|nr:hypothetical protein [Candidatus Micrarchaeota archaeon]
MYLAFCGLVIVVALSSLGSMGGGAYSLIGAVFILVALGVLLVMNWADFVIFPLVTNLLGVSFQPAKDYRIVKTQDAVVKNVNGLFYATGYVTANVFAYTFKAEQQQQDQELKAVQAPETWERAVMNIGFPFKYHVLSAGLDVQKVRDELEGKRSFQEFQLSRAMQAQNVNEMTVTEIQRKINVLQTKIARIGEGEKPIATIMYFETTAVGVSEKAALDLLSAQIKQLEVAMSGMDVQLARIVGRELYTLFQFNFSLPTTYEEAATNFDIQS